MVVVCKLWVGRLPLNSERLFEALSPFTLALVNATYCWTGINELRKHVTSVALLVWVLNAILHLWYGWYTSAFYWYWSIAAMLFCPHIYQPLTLLWTSRISCSNNWYIFSLYSYKYELRYVLLCDLWDVCWKYMMRLLSFKCPDTCNHLGLCHTCTSDHSSSASSQDLRRVNISTQTITYGICHTSVPKQYYQFHPKWDALAPA